MNLLLDRLPTDFEGLEIETNFRSFILFELLMQDNELKIEEKIYLALKIFYKDIPSSLKIKDLKKMTDGIVWFYTCGEEEKPVKNKKTEDRPQQKIYSFKYDAKYIYSAFLDQYGIDLNEIKYLHWFKFRALFESLKDDNKICEIMGYRAIDLNKIKDEEEKKKYRKLKNKWALPDNRTVEETERDFANAFW